MPTIFEKMNLKDQGEILVLGAPSSFEPELEALDGVVVVRDVKKIKTVRFALAFATKLAEVERLAPALATKAEGDSVLWFAYPKGTSKKYRCDFNRDNGWDALHAAGFEPVRQVAIDEDWSALRFRRSEFVGSTGGSRQTSAAKGKTPAKLITAAKKSTPRGQK